MKVRSGIIKTHLVPQSSFDTSTEATGWRMKTACGLRGSINPRDPELDFVMGPGSRWPSRTILYVSERPEQLGNVTCLVCRRGYRAR